ncbi:MAG: V4R domain-containing protein, partial [Candidatus Freyarchaeota archaeon]
MIARAGLNIVYSYFSATRLGETGAFLYFIDFTGADIKPEELSKQIMSLDTVEKVEIIRPKVEGFIADTVSFPLTIGQFRVIIIDEITLKGLLVNARERIGSAAEPILYFLGSVIGSEWAKEFSKLAELIGIKDLQKKVAIFTDIFVAEGYGIGEVVKFEASPPYCLVRVRRCIECELGRGAGKPFSHLIRGMIAGFFSEIIGVKMFAKEIQCIAQGDPHCEFEVKP